jgi:hypothetical protein
MSRRPTIETERLTLRRWHKADLKPFAALNSDPVVMEHFPQLLELSRRRQTASPRPLSDVGGALGGVESGVTGSAFIVCRNSGGIP